MAQLSSYVVMSNDATSCECEFETEPPQRGLHPLLFGNSVGFLTSHTIYYMSARVVGRSPRFIGLIREE